MTVISRRDVPERRYLDPAPTTMLGAQYSLPYCVALALSRDLSDPGTLSDDILQEGTIRKIAANVEVRSDPDRFADAPDDVTAEIEIELGGDCQKFTADTFPGSPTRPLDFDGACGKLRRYARLASTPERIARMIEQVRHLEELDNVSGLAALLGSP